MPGRSPERTTLLAASSHEQRQAGRLGSGQALGPEYKLSCVARAVNAAWRTEVTSILFVCLGNICRSPTAEMVLRARLPDMKNVASAGTSAVGGPIDARAAAALERAGIKPVKRFRSRQFETADFERYDLIVAMDGNNLADILERRPEGARARVQRLLDFVPELQGRDVPDPYYGPAAGFDNALRLIEQGIDGMIAGMGDAPKRGGL